MQRTGKKKELSLFLFLGVLIIVAIILLVQEDHAGWLFFLVPAWLVLGITSFSFWFRFGSIYPVNLPGLNSTQSPTWYFPGILSPIYVLQSGKLQRDYFLLRNKPRIGLLYIYPDSVAVVQSKDGQKRILQPGFHYLGRHKEIFLCYKIGISQFVIGPLAEENPFDQKRSSESYTAYHSRRLRAQKVKAFTRDSREIFASLRVVYLLGNDEIQIKESGNGLLQRVSTDLQQMNRDGEAAQTLEDFFSRRIIDLWTAKISQVKSEEMRQGGIIDRIMTEINSAMINPGQSSKKYAAHQEGTAEKNYENSEEWSLPFYRVYLDMLWMQPNQGSSTEKKP